MDYNAVIPGRDLTDESEIIVEPVTLEEAKDYLKLQGFIPDDESPSTSITDYDDEDSLIEEFITTAREYMEERLGLSIVFHTREATMTNLSSKVEIPYGPIIDVVSLIDKNGDPITTYTLVGNLWKYLESPSQKDMVITYNAGFDDVLTTPLPTAFKTCIKRVVAHLYEHRGDELIDYNKIREIVDGICSIYSRNSPWA